MLLFKAPSFLLVSPGNLSAPDWAPHLPTAPLSNQLTEPALPLGHHSPTALCLDTQIDLLLPLLETKCSQVSENFLSILSSPLFGIYPNHNLSNSKKRCHQVTTLRSPAG